MSDRSPRASCPPVATTTATCDSCDWTGTTDRAAEKHCAPGHSTVTHNRTEGSK